MFCANCGHQNEPGFKFCASCGGPLAAAPPAPPAPGPDLGALAPASPAAAPQPSWSPSPPSGGVPPPVPEAIPSPPTTAGPAAPSWGVPPIGGVPDPGAGGFTPNPPAASWTPPAAEPLSSPPLSSASSGLPIVPIVIVVVVLLGLGLFFMRGKPKPAVTPTPVISATSPPPSTPSSPSSPQTPSTPSSPSTPSAPVGVPTQSGAKTTVRMTDAVMCRSVDNNGKAVDPTRRFEPRQPFFCSLRVLGVKQGSVLVAYWQNPAGKGIKKQLVSDRVGDYYIYFSLNPPNERPWELGKYSVSLIADGVLQQTVDFEVVSPGLSSNDNGGSTPSAEAANHVEEAVPCKSVDDRHRPVDRATVFPTDIPAIYVAVHVRDVERGRPVVTKWLYNGKTINEIKINAPRKGSGWLSYKLGAPKWPAGDYKVEVLYDGTLARTIEFAVH